MADSSLPVLKGSARVELSEGQQGRVIMLIEYRYALVVLVLVSAAMLLTYYFREHFGMWEYTKWRPDGRHSCPVSNSWWNGSEGLKIAFVGPRFHSWDSYHNMKGYMGGEAYWAASVHFVLREFGYDVDFLDHFDPTIPNKNYYRLIFDGYPQQKISGLIRWPKILCRSRVLHFWGGIEWKSEDPRLAGVDPRLVITPYMDPKYPASPVPFFPHSLVYNGSEATSSRARTGFILGKKCTYFSEPQVQHLIFLLSESFELHSTANCFSNMNIIIHGMLPPASLINVLRGMSFCCWLWGTFNFSNPSRSVSQWSYSASPCWAASRIREPRPSIFTSI